MKLDMRLLGPEDAAAFQALRLEGLARHPCAFAASDAEESDHSLEEVAARLGRQTVFGAFLEGALVGVAGFAREPLVKKRHKGILWGVYVRAPVRGRGLARALISRVVEHAREHVVQLHVTVVATNHAARRLYRELGFAPYGLEPQALACAGEYVDQQLMVLMLTPTG